MHNHRRREEQRKEQVKLEKTASGVNQYYRIGPFTALRVIGGFGYYIHPQQNNPKPHPQAITLQPQTNKFEMD